jgi:hypothetical protein
VSSASEGEKKLEIKYLKNFGEKNNKIRKYAVLLIKQLQNPFMPFVKKN